MIGMHDIALLKLYRTGELPGLSRVILLQAMILHRLNGIFCRLLEIS
jgi:hypothetical protein